jgi:hypothetical protein
MAASFSAPVQNCPGGSPSLLYNGYRISFPGIKRQGRGADHLPPYKSRGSRKSRVIPLPNFEASVACYRENLYLLQYNIKSCYRQCIAFPQASFYAKCFGQWSLDFSAFRFESFSIIVIKCTNLFGIQNLFKISYNFSYIPMY